MTEPLAARQIIDALRTQGVDWAVSVPDWVQLPLYKQLLEGPGFNVTPACAEDEAVAIAGGLSVAGRNPIVLVQNQGLYASVNNIRAITLDAEIPMVFLVGQFGLEAARIGEPFASSGRRVVRLLPRLLEALEIDWRPLDSVTDLPNLAWAYEQVQDGNSAVLVMSRNMAWGEAA